MSSADRIYLFLAEGTSYYNQLVALVGKPTSVQPTKEAIADEYVNSIDLKPEATLSKVYDSCPISTFSILA